MTNEEIKKIIVKGLGPMGTIIEALIVMERLGGINVLHWKSGSPGTRAAYVHTR